MTMNGAWGWVPTDSSWKSADTLVRTLIEAASRGGNFLLNVGPRGDGTFPPEAVERLEAVGAWMDRCGDGVWGTTYGPVQGHPTLRSTERDGTVYLHLLDWPQVPIEVSGLGAQVESMSLLGGPTVPFTRTPETLRIALPASRPHPGVNVVAVRTAG
jgi:alpha-L-fucosidase